MANRSTAPGRIALMGLVVAGALTGMAGTAGAQYYYYDDGYDPYPAYGYRDDYGYAPRPRAVVPRAAPAPVSPYEINRIAARDYGLVRIERSIRRDDTYAVDGETANGQRLRLILDAYAGDLIRRVPLRGRTAAAPHVARAEPRQDQTAPRPRLVPQPPERPAELKPPAQASAPATAAPPSPATPPAPEPAAPAEKAPVEASAPATASPPAPAAPPAPEPAKPAEQPPLEASAPATASPPPAAKPAEPSPGPANPETGADKPKLVEPGSNPAEAQKPEGSAEPAQSTASAPAPEAPAAQPVAPAPKPEAPKTEPARPGVWIPPFAPTE
ncbi:putative protein OS=Bosea thiooxidans OX=53254 GN=SAMN05660750_02448 PE=4 SV=1 [Bosea thiooxidans]|uniref:Uncharacterized protein n=2 Tax=Bosea thiooxidans TaxID=53254 RepID=A0A1T5E8C2_9HYPH|nr:hypothetical protein [Bosea thiooxidans]SKB80257.1 hypothetical protein SAMN05660750_02448 [Bosea thiooxidans]